MSANKKKGGSGRTITMHPAMQRKEAWKKIMKAYMVGIWFVYDCECGCFVGSCVV